MLYYLGSYLELSFGPFRLLTSYLFLLGLGFFLCGFLTWRLLPRLAEAFMPRDRGRAFAVESQTAQGKPTGTGMIFIPIFVAVQLLVFPWSWDIIAALILTLGAALFGFLDDRSTLSWGEYKKGLIDLIIALSGALLLCRMGDVEIWWPFTKEITILPSWLYVGLSTIWIWAAINATNCTDGVDGLSGTLVSIAFLSLGALLYFALGHKDVANYLLLPHLSDGAAWGAMAFCMAATLAGYLWYNAHPSSLLMGDAGSRALGFLLGFFSLKSGNPLLIFLVSCVLLVNGGTGLVKVALLRFFKIAIFRNVRFPLHDHVRHNLKWSTPQVLVRFALIQVLLTVVLGVLLLKIR